MSKAKKTMYHLPFVNDDKPFALEKWTNKKQEEVWAEASKYEKSLSEEQLNRKYRKLLILTGLKDVAPDATESDLDDMHPDDVIALYTAVYLQGKRGILKNDDATFRAKDSKKKPISK